MTPTNNGKCVLMQYFTHILRYMRSYKAAVIDLHDKNPSPDLTEALLLKS